MDYLLSLFLALPCQENDFRPFVIATLPSSLASLIRVMMLPCRAELLPRDVWYHITPKLFSRSPHTSVVCKSSASSTHTDKTSNHCCIKWQNNNNGWQQDINDSPFCLLDMQYALALIYSSGCDLNPLHFLHLSNLWTNFWTFRIKIIAIKII